MTWPTIVAAHELVAGAELVVSGEEFRHLRVRRLRAGDHVRVIDGRGSALLATIEKMGRREAILKLGDRLLHSNESWLQLSLAVALIRTERLEYALEKATELGVHRLVLVRCERTRPIDVTSRLPRWRRIVQEAAKQSQRSLVPPVTYSPSVRALLEHTPRDLGVVLDIDNGPALPAKSSIDTLGAPRCPLIVIGPEGGFSPAERAAFRSAGFVPIALGPRILRTETAVVAAVTLAQFFWGDLKPPQSDSP